ncbi:hypothetical protein HPULCUR_007875 [Helicostylum pulchrum]|uniref:VanZ-like domain-containing protein n=1 Tax=Helicostylum pulchrum TaxID=562976 RepID=A0ABP9Y601_9FUNG
MMGVLGFAPIKLDQQVNDKLLHFGIFFVLACFLYFLWNLNYRSFDVQDIIANLTGGITGIIVSSLIDYCIDIKRENKRRFGGKREAEYQSALMEEESFSL